MPLHAVEGAEGVQLEGDDWARSWGESFDCVELGVVVGSDDGGLELEDVVDSVDGGFAAVEAVREDCCGSIEVAKGCGNLVAVSALDGGEEGRSVGVGEVDVRGAGGRLVDAEPVHETGEVRGHFVVNLSTWRSGGKRNESARSEIIAIRTQPR